MKIDATIYHSLVIKNNTLHENFKIISDTIDDNKKVIMGIQHIKYPIYGVQFHPESIATTPYGKKIIKNFLEI